MRAMGKRVVAVLVASGVATVLMLGSTGTANAQTKTVPVADLTGTRALDIIDDYNDSVLDLLMECWPWMSSYSGGFWGGQVELRLHL